MRVKSILKSGYVTSQKHLENAVKYCDRQGTLFDGSGREKNPDDVITDLSKPRSVVWTCIYSLSAEDCKRLGVDRDYLKNLMTAKSSRIAEIYNISPKNFRMTCSFHDKDFHPHLHFFMWSTNPNEGYIPHPNGDKPDENLNKATRQLKSLLTNEIFAGDTLHLKQAKSENREYLNQQLQSAVAHPISTEVLEGLAALSDNLKGVKGKHTYKYLPPEIKQQVDELFKLICEKEDAVGRAARAYLDTKKDMHLLYASDDEVLEQHFDKMENEFYHPDYKSSNAKAEVTRHNIIIKAADQMANHGRRDKVPADLGEPETEWSEAAAALPEPELPEVNASTPEGSSREKNISEGWRAYRSGKELAKEGSETYDPGAALVAYRIAEQNGIPWASYQIGKLYSDKQSELYDAEAARAAYQIFLDTSDVGKEWAHYQLGRLYNDPQSEIYSPDDALRSFAAADAGGAAEGSYHYGKMLEAREDATAAFRAYCRAAERGSLTGQYKAAQCFAKGKGCERNLDAAQSRLESIVAKRVDGPKTKREIFQNEVCGWAATALAGVHCSRGKELLAKEDYRKAYAEFSAGAQGSLAARYYKAKLEISGKGCPKNKAQGRTTLAEIASMTPANEYEQTIVDAAKGYFEYSEKSRTAAAQQMVFKLVDNLLGENNANRPQQHQPKPGRGFRNRKQAIRVIHKGVGEETNVGMDDL